MKRLLQYFLLFIVMLFCSFVKAQIINIPDANFKARLLQDSGSGIAEDSLGNSIKIDINDDGNIQQSEAQRVYNLYVSFSASSSSVITDLTGIEYFTNLRRLDCFENQLSSLDVSNLVNLTILSCHNNQLTSLNVSGLTNLTHLYCYENQLPSLNVSGLTNLIRLECFGNQLTSLDVSGLVNLNFFTCHDNLLTSLNLDGLYNLETLGCNENQLLSLNISDLINLQDLHCSINKLSSLSLNGFNKLRTLYCNGNQLTNLNLFGAINVERIFCGYNLLTSINVSGLTKLSYFDCMNNNLISIYMKNGKSDSSLIAQGRYLFAFNPNLHYICADDSDFIALKQFSTNHNINNVSINSFCSSTLNGSYYTLNGKFKYDIDNNGCSHSDPILPNVTIKIRNAVDSGFIMADNQGNYSLALDSGTYTLTPQMPNNYLICAPVSIIVAFPEDTIPQQFCITPNGIHHDVSVNIIPLNPARPGFSDATYKIVLKNKGNQIENGTIVFNYDESKQDYISATLSPTNTQSSQLTFNFSNLQLFETREIIVTMRTNAPTDIPTVNAGDVLVLYASASINADENLDDNSQQINQTVISSFDPNDKTCLEGEIITPSLIGDYVHYLIRFENTGTANAENVVVTDFIDLAKFDISTLEIISTSNSCKTLISNGNKVQFVFDNINLPFTEPDKHGYVAFKIKTKSNLVVGDSLKNNAEIYFDYNLPITTNTATSRIENVTAVKTNSSQKGTLNVYPNPSNGQATINFESPYQQLIIIRLISVDGNIIYEQNINHLNKSQIQLNKNLPSGIYLITINGEKEQYTQKLIITK